LHGNVIEEWAGVYWNWNPFDPGYMIDYIVEKYISHGPQDFPTLVIIMFRNRKGDKNVTPTPSTG